MNTLYNPNGNSNGIPEGNTMESSGNDYEDKFVRILVDEIITVLDIGYSERQIISKLLYTSLKPKLVGRSWRDDDGGLLEQYKASVLDHSIKRIKEECDVPDDITVDHSHADHAKFASIARWIKEDRLPLEQILGEEIECDCSKPSDCDTPIECEITIDPNDEIDVNLNPDILVDDDEVPDNPGDDAIPQNKN